MSLGIEELGRQAARARQVEGRRQVFLQQWLQPVAQVPDIGLDAAGAPFIDELHHLLGAVGADELHVDAGNMRAERLDHRPHDLVDDQGRVEDDLALLLGGFDELGIGAHRPSQEMAGAS